MTPNKEHKELSKLIEYCNKEYSNKEYDSILKERELVFKECLLNGFTHRQEPILIRKDFLYGYCYPPYKDVLGNWIAYS